MNLLFVTSGLGIGGAERVLTNLAKYMPSSSIRVTILSLTSSKNEFSNDYEEGVKVFHLDQCIKGLAVKKLFRLLQQIRKERFDVIQGWMYHGNIVAFLIHIFLLRKPRLYWSIRQTLYSLSNEKTNTKIFIYLNRFFSNFPEKIIFNSSVAIEQHQKFGFSHANCLLIDNGFSRDENVNWEYQRTIYRKKLSFAEDDLVIGNISRFHPMKDHENFIKAALEVARHLPETKFMLIGSGVNQQILNWHALIPKKFQHRFIFLDNTNNVEFFLNTFDIFCLSSAWGEGMPNVIGEAMSLGVPCISTDVGDAGRLIGKTGKVVRINNHMILAQAMKDMLNESEEVRRARGKAAKARIEAHFSSEKMNNEYFNLFLKS